MHKIGRPLLIEQRHKARTTNHGDRHHLLSSNGIASKFSVLSQYLLQITCNLFHRHILSIGTYPGDREPNVHSGTLSPGEQLRIKIDLTVRDRNHIGHNVRRDVVGQCLHYRQRRQRASSFPGGQHRRTLQQPGVEIKHISGVRLTSRRSSQQQGELAVCHSLLREVVVNDQTVPSTMHEVFPHRDPTVRRKELQTRRLGSGGSHDSGVAQSTVAAEEPVDTSHIGATLADGDVDGQHSVLGQNLTIHADLIDNRAHCQRGLSGLTIPHDELSLASTYRNKRVYALKACKEVVVHRRTRYNIRRIGIHTTHFLVARKGHRCVVLISRGNLMT
mmetsp:Transcript_32139/g.44042  ORF Transcript_32139/g.44042 Transcript_32139/m.44042 type:complete len:332 (+) Transcript_32139:631-1626(+)